MGGSLYDQLRAADLGETRPLAGVVPAPVADPLLRLRGLHAAIRQGAVRACHDCSEGGLAVALAEMALAGRLGATVDLACVPLHTEPNAADLTAETVLFAESLGRFIVEVTPAAADAFTAALAGCAPLACIGEVTAAPQLIWRRDLQTLAALDLAALLRAWKQEEN